MNSGTLDEAAAVRSGEELDAGKVSEYVKQALPEIRGEAQIKQFPGGASNLTYLLKFDNKELILRRPPFGTKAKSAHDMGRECQIISKLSPVFPYVPRIYEFCADPAVIGSEFYLMERLVGTIPRAELPSGLTLSAQQCQRLCAQFINCWLELHNVDYNACGLSQLGKGEGYVQRQIEGWNKRFVAAKTKDVPDCEKVMAWLDENQPPQLKTCIIHNDFRLDNVVLDPADPTRIIGVLDWEMATLGDPMMDLGCGLAYWVEASDPEPMHLLRRQPSHLPGMFSRNEIVAEYCKRSGINIENFLFYRIYGLFRLAVIVQQIYYRYFHGQTKDKRFQGFGVVVGLLESECQKLIAEAC